MQIEWRLFGRWFIEQRILLLDSGFIGHFLCGVEFGQCLREQYNKVS